LRQQEKKDYIGWDLLGFEGHHGALQYPFGYYDAQFHGDANHGAHFPGC